ncbi:M28 family peptidase [Sphingomonas sp.]|uniref:M28 family peptidase n=1 Tax=Sphingomonas sp. TaxID=28214 RepID=UPI000DB15A24|nr:M28 family peptidase [Sphingomonas sp.]PZU10895.1 MAG: peptidase M28 [Sphingomonas sp.]
MMLPFLLAIAAAGHRPPRAPALPDRDTAAWWQATQALSGDDMEGRDTGSAGYDRAARLVAAGFARAGLKPAGDNGSFFQTLRLGDVTIEKEGTSVAMGGRPLRFLYDLTLRASPGMPTQLDAPLAFRGYCGRDMMADVRGKVVLCYGTRKPGLPAAPERIEAAKAGGAIGLLTIADPSFTVEPPRWPAAYARTVSFEDAPPPANDDMLIGTVNADALGALLAGGASGAEAIVAEGSAGRPLPAFDAPGRLVAHVVLSHRALRSDNVLALLPGTDPVLKNEIVVVSAHLDGYGFGEAVDGDALYNGAFDDAAYVALLQQLADRRAGKGYRRSVLFAAFTGEEKGLLGATHFTDHPTVPLKTIVADINLDQIRPIFPLDLLTVHALNDSSLGDDVREVAARQKIAVRIDPEPERNLLTRADHWPFIRKGIPATGFVFGYKPGSPSEKIYRGWYETRYHRPQDDLSQPINWQAAARFNRFFYDLTQKVADAPARPAWKADSAYAGR